MRDIADVFFSTLRCSWELPRAPKKIITRFAEHAGTLATALFVFAILSLCAALFDPTRLTGHLADIAPSFQYSLGNLIAVFVENAALSIFNMSLAVALVYLLGGPVSINRLLYARLPIEGFGVVWLGLVGFIENQFKLGGGRIFLLVFLIIVIASILYFVRISYEIGGGLAPVKAMQAMGIEFVTFIVLFGYYNMRSETL